MSGPFDTPFEGLPERLPVFPLCGALLLPRCRLPLNIFEPRYLQMTEDALAANRLIGMVQPVDASFDVRVPPLFETGCAGRSKEFLEAGKRRLMGDTKRDANSGDVNSLRTENGQLKELVAELSLRNQVLKKSLTGTGEDLEDL